MTKLVKKRNKKYVPKKSEFDVMARIEPVQSHIQQAGEFQIFMFIDLLTTGKLSVTAESIAMIDQISERIVIACEYFKSVYRDDEWYAKSRSILVALADLVDAREEKQHGRYIANADQLRAIRLTLPELVVRMRSVRRIDIDLAQKRAKAYLQSKVF